MKQSYKITENLPDHPTYNGQELTIDLNLGNDYYELVDIDGNRFMAGEEELTKVENTDFTYKVVCNLNEMDFYTDDKETACNTYQQYISDYGTGIRLYEAPKPTNEDDCPEWDLQDAYDGEEYEIKITGQGTPEDIVKALRQVAAAIESKAIRETLDSPEIEDLDGAEWEDFTLMTEINKK